MVMINITCNTCTIEGDKMDDLKKMIDDCIAALSNLSDYLSSSPQSRVTPFAENT
jgi:hypothetical protein